MRTGSLHQPAFAGILRNPVSSGSLDRSFTVLLRHSRKLSLPTVILVFYILGAEPAHAAEPGAASVVLPGGSCALPDAIRSTTGHVLFRYMLRGGNEAKQIKPVFVRVEPEAHREAFLAATESCVARQAAKGRSPDPLRDVRYLAFHFVSPAPTGAPRMKLGPGRSLPTAWIEEVRSHKVALAREILAEPLMIERVLPGVRLLSNAGETAVDEIAQGIGFAIKSFDKAFPDARPAPESAELTILVIRDADGFEQLAAFDNVAAGTESAVWRSRIDERIVTVAAPHDRPYRIMAGLVIRDVTRHLVGLRLAPEGEDLPYWVDDGLAAFFQCLNWRRDRFFDLAEVERQWEVRGMYKYRLPGGVMLEVLARYSEVGHPLSFTDLPSDAATSRTALESLRLHHYVEVSQSERIVLGHPLAWIAVHFLLNGEGGAHRKAFQDWIADPGNDKTVESLPLALNRTLPSLDEALRAHHKAIW